jgi:hypothetical protein
MPTVLELEHLSKAEFSALSRIFSNNILTDLAKHGKSSNLKNIFIEILGQIKSSDTTPLIQIIEDIYNQLFKSYRSEYLIKNIVANKILLGKHSINTTKMLTEFRVGESKADILMLNGTSHIYEIKSEYDNLERLNKQINDYQEFAEFVSIITTENHLNKLLLRTNENIGIITLTNNGSLKTIRKAASNIALFNPLLSFNSLRKSEYIQILQDFKHEIPDVPNTKIHTECKKIFAKINHNECQKNITKRLKKRDHRQHQNNFIVDSPSALKAFAISSKLNKQEEMNLTTALNKNLNYHLQ